FPTKSRKNKGEIVHIVGTRDLTKKRDPKSGEVVVTKALEAVGQSRIHGLRHTFRTAASNAGVEDLRTKLLMNHELPKGDMSARYLNAGAEALRPDQQRITDHLLALIDPKGGKVVKMSDMKRRG